MRFPNGLLEFSDSIRDPDDDPLTYSITLSDSSIAQVSIDCSTGNANFTALKAGQTTGTITASDGISGEVSSIDEPLGNPRGLFLLNN
ncbi:hypothetical protein EMIT07CA2_60021 [Brevibacillus sp. IT-7CA2]